MTTGGGVGRGRGANVTGPVEAEGPEGKAAAWRGALEGKADGGEDNGARGLLDAVVEGDG